MSPTIEPLATSRETSSSATIPPNRRRAWSSARRVTSVRRLQGAAAGRLHPGEHPGRRGSVREAGEQLGEEGVRLPALRRGEELVGAPAAERGDGAAPDGEDLAGDRLSLVRAEGDDDGRDVGRIERIEALRRRIHLERLLGHP